VSHKTVVSEMGPPHESEGGPGHARPYALLTILPVLPRLVDETIWPHAIVWETHDGHADEARRA
jgi:hypothetical protein